VADRLAGLLERLDALDGPSGDEEPVMEAVTEIVGGAADRQATDALGSRVFTREGPAGAPSLLLAAHTDELGFVVQHVEDDGFLRLAPVGYHDDRMAVNQHLHVHGDHGRVLGVSGATPFHLTSPAERQQAIPLRDLWVDVGTTSRAATEALGVRPGHLVTFARRGEWLAGGTVFTGKAVDDRAGCAVLAELLLRLDGRALPVTLHAAFTVQEELGSRGAGPVGTTFAPDVALAVDVTACGDTPGLALARAPIRLGAGPGIMYWDFAPTSGSGNAVPRRLTRRLEAAAAAAGVEPQRGVLHGGATDAAPIARSGAGVLAGGVQIPARSIHTAVGTVHRDDLEGAVRLLEAFVVETG
jgi:putative aminopeptidase FrvX